MHFDFVTEAHEYDGRQDKQKCLDIPTEPVDPHFHAHEFHGLFDARFLFVDDRLGRQYNSECKAEHYNKWKQCDNHDIEFVIVVWWKWKAFHRQTNCYRLVDKLFQQTEFNGFLYGQKAFSIISLRNGNF